MNVVNIFTFVNIFIFYLSACRYRLSNRLFFSTFPILFVNVRPIYLKTPEYSKLARNL